MAGDWIRLRTGLEASLKTMRIADTIGIAPREVVVNLYLVAAWFRTHGKEGKHRCPVTIIDTLLQSHGFGQSLVDVGWLRVEGEAVTLSGFTDVSATRKSIGRKMRNEILKSGACALCGATEKLEIDHIVPVKKGGRTERSNLQPLCQSCNRKKGAR